jgi:predicted nuclease with TOPRIM domain
MELYNSQMEISNEFNPMHGIIMLAGSQLFLVIMFYFASNVNDKKHEALQQKYYALKHKYDVLESKNEEDIDDYNELVEKYNTLLDEHVELEEKNETDIADYNELVDKYNELVDSTETRISRLESRISRNFRHKP